MKVILDTNVLVSAFVFRRSCAELFERCIDLHQLVTSRHILGEFRRTLDSTFGFSRREAWARSRLIAQCSRVVVPAPLPEGACRDPDDIPVLGTAVAANCDCIVTSDKDLLVLKVYKGISILSPSEFWRFEHEQENADGRTEKR